MLDRDYFSIPEEEIRNLQSAMTVVGGVVVYTDGDFAGYAPPALPVAADWAPTLHYGGYHNKPTQPSAMRQKVCCGDVHKAERKVGESLWGLGCDCFAF